jgi:purine-binding chemotaxis protein CheW
MTTTTTTTTNGAIVRAGASPGSAMAQSGTRPGARIGTRPGAKIGAEVTAAAAEQLYLAFRLGGEVYAVDILRVREIIEYTPPTVVPMMPPSLRGVINLRGAVVPVLDLAIRFGGAATQVGRRTCIVIVEIGHEGTTQNSGLTQILGLLVDGVNGVMGLAAADLEPPPEFGTGIRTDFIAGMASGANGFTIVLDIAKVLSIDEIAAVTTASTMPRD